MDLRTLRAFVEVVRQGGFSPAAKALFVTQPTISKAIRQLEDELGIPLLDRHGHRITPSAAGDIVFRHASRMLALRDELKAELQDLAGLARGTLKIGLPLVGSSLLFAPLFTRYRQQHPGIDIQLSEHGSLQLETLLRAGQLELAASLLPIADDFDFQVVRREPLMVLMPASHPLAGRATLRLNDLRDEPLVLQESGFVMHRMVRQACAQRGFEPTIAAQSSQVEFLIALVASGLGLAFLPRLVIDKPRQTGLAAVLLDEPDIRWDLAMVWHREAYLSQAAQAWLALLASQTPATPPTGEATSR